MADFMFQLLPDLVELGFDHRRRHVEIMRGGELVEQLALHIGARQAVHFLLDLILHQLFQLVEAFEAQRLGELVVDLRFGGNLDFLHRDGEFGLGSFQIGTG